MLAFMEFHNLYRTLVVGGAMLAGACATTEKKPAPTEGQSATGPESPAEPTKGVSSEDEETSTEDSPVEETPAENPTDEVELACDEICDGGEGRERICPDPANGGDNCCWLMFDPHPCCD
jgi:hypothetical protein